MNILIVFRLGTLQLVSNHQVCFQSRDHKYGNFTVDIQPGDYKLKLVHFSGGISCQSGFSYAPFGCVTYRKPTVSRMSVVITDDKNKKILPGSEGYMHDGNDGNSTYILFENIVHLQQGRQLRLWYDEDFNDKWTHDNFGTSCAYVLARKED